MSRHSRVASLALLLLAIPALAETFGTIPGKGPHELFPWATFDPAIPTQEEVTGVVPGSRPLRHAELMGYLRALADASPRAAMEPYAKTWEGRELVAFVVSDEATVAGLDDFRQDHARRMDPRGRSASEDASALEGAKAVAWMAYGIHGDELSSVDAAAALAYWLVAGEDERAKMLREELVVLIDPMENPDGRDRYLAQTRSFAHALANPDQDDLSHTTVWPWGRGNHYLFDLNRDWFTMVHPESWRSHVIAGWHPQLVVDSHEMGDNDTYLLSPPRAPFNPLLPDYTADWWGHFASDQAVALDGRGYGYYTREWNEEFFPGYGSSWAAYLGAIGILYEMSGTAGTLVRREDGTVRTYAEAVEHQVTSSLANLETLAAGRPELLADFVAARRRAVAEPKGPARAWLLPPGERPKRTDALAALLRDQGIELLRATGAVTVAGARDARTGVPAGRELPAGTWMVPLDQPLSPLASVLLDPHVPMAADALQAERESIESGEGSRGYDVNAWSLPLLHGVEALWTTQRPAGPWSAEPAAEPVPAEPVTETGDGPAYGYLLDGNGDSAMAALAELLQQGLRIQVADRAFRVAGFEGEPGALLIPTEGNPDDLRDRLRAVAERWSVAFRSTGTALAEEGPDLGGSHFRSLVSPRVGVLAGVPASPSDYGSVWFVLDQRAGLRFNSLDTAWFSRVELERYDVLVFPPSFGGGGAWAQALGEAGVAKLKAWIEAGGTAIGLDGGALFLADKATGLTSTHLRRQALDSHPPGMMGASAAAAEAAGPLRATGRPPTPLPAGATASVEIPPVLGPGARPFAPGAPAPSLESTPLAEWVQPTLPPGRSAPAAEDLERADRRLRDFAPRGALLRAEVDPKHWLAWGLPDEITVLMGSSSALVADDGAEVAARFPAAERLHLGGLLWPEAAGRLAHTAYATRERVGDGQVILFVDHPTYRAWPLDSQRMFLNAVLYGPGLGTSRPRPW